MFNMKFPGGAYPWMTPPINPDALPPGFSAPGPVSNPYDPNEKVRSALGFNMKRGQADMLRDVGIGLLANSGIPAAEGVALGLSYGQQRDISRAKMQREANNSAWERAIALHKIKMAQTEADKPAWQQVEYYDPAENASKKGYVNTNTQGSPLDTLTSFPGGKPLEGRKVWRDGRAVYVRPGEEIGEQAEQYSSTPKSYEHAGTGETRVFDAKNPQDVAELRAGPWRPARTTEVSGTPTEWGLSNKDKSDLREAEVAARNATQTGMDFLTRLDQNPNALSVAGEVAALTGGLAYQATSMLHAAGIDIEDDSVLSEDHYSDQFRKLGIDNAQMRGQIFDMALAYASAAGLGSGRSLSDKDVAHAITRISGRWGSSNDQKKAVMQDVLRMIERNFKNRYRVYMGRDFEGTLGWQGGQGAPRPPASGGAVDAGDPLGLR